MSKRTFRSGQGAASDAEKKVGVGARADINWFNIQLPFSFVLPGDATVNVWELSAISFISPSIAHLSVSGYVSIDTDQDIFLPDFSSVQPGYRFNSTKMAIVSGTVVTGSNLDLLCGFGFDLLGTTAVNKIIIGPGNPNSTVGFVRNNAGQWFLQTSDGSGFTTTAVSIPDGVHNFRIEYDPGNATPQARFYVDGILLGTHFAADDLPYLQNSLVGFSAGLAGGSDEGITAVGCPSFAVEI